VLRRGGLPVRGANVERKAGRGRVMAVTNGQLRHPTFHRIFGRAELPVGLNLPWDTVLRDFQIQLELRSQPKRRSISSLQLLERVGGVKDTRHICCPVECSFAVDQIIDAHRGTIAYDSAFFFAASNGPPHV
jgi:hypothetical protein